jgi:cephalosporin hydroxylase
MTLEKEEHRMARQDTQPEVRDDTQSCYHSVKSEASAAMTRGVWRDRFPERFVPMATRELRSDLPRQSFRILSEGKHFQSYRGVAMAKDPLDIVLYEMLFYELQPRTVIELGAYTGASAMWMADTLANCGVDARVLAVDIDLELIDPAAMSHPGTRFLQGDLNAIEQVLPPSVLADLPHPWIVIDDAHVNIEGVYQYFHEFGLRKGDYFVIEDTVPWIPGRFGASDDELEWGDWKWDEIRTFFCRHGDEYLVDRYFTDFFGYNGTWNWNGFLRRMS